MVADPPPPSTVMDVECDASTSVDAALAAPAAVAAPLELAFLAPASTATPLGMRLTKASPDGPAVVAEVDPDGLAAAGGVVAGDALLAVGSDTVDGWTEAQLQQRIADARVHGEVLFKFARRAG